jgi:TRAP-type mannitol/chloroaromatic compound transport system permease small subunit
LISRQFAYFPIDGGKPRWNGAAELLSFALRQCRLSRQSAHQDGRSAAGGITFVAITVGCAWIEFDARKDFGRRLMAAGRNTMRPLLALSSAVDLINEKVGYVCNFLVLASCVVSAVNAMIRYAFGYSSNGWLELQWYMFAILVMFGASYTFKRNEHVRVEIFYLFLSERGQLWLDLIGTLFFLIPACLLLAYLSWPFFMQAYAVGEISGNAGGLIRWPIKFVIPAGFVMLALQGVSEVIKRIAALQGELTIDAKYERPTQ